uniref:CRAL-TRIO domain-containing protein n=2 Tax=Ciona intestinalis TaxID=7719 RepID=F7AVL3_CIOIN
RYECRLSREDLKKAQAELNEPISDQERIAAIDVLRESFQTKHPEVTLANDSDVFMLRFLRSKKFNQEKALTKLYKYQNNYSTWGEVFDKVRNPVLLKPLIEAGVVVPLKGRAKDGSVVVVGRPGIVQHTWIDMMAMIILTAETLLQDEHTQIYGMTVVIDQAYFTMELAKQYTPAISRRFGGFMQDSLPARVKSMNLTNQGKIWDIVWAIAQPFLKDKMKKRFRIHGTEFSTLYDVIDRSILPPMFAGNGPPLDPEEWKSHVISEDTAL